MKLPEPARTLWTRHRVAIERIATTPGAESHIMLGGGTLLAARWKHRESTDIDVLLPGRDNLNDARENGPLDLAAATGGEHKESSRDRLRVELQIGMLGVAAIQPQMPGLEEQLDVEGRNETVLASAQILRGKFYRTDKGITRDAFDFAVAADKDPRALELAVNSLDMTDTRIICHNLLASNDQMVDDASETLKGVPSEYHHHLKRIGDAAADAIVSHRYAHVRIRTTETGIRIETRTSDGSERTEDYAAGESINALTRSGIGAYLGANSTLQRGGLAMTLDSLNEIGWTGTVFDSDDSAPEQRLDDTRKSAGLRKLLRIGDVPENPPRPPRPAASGGDDTVSRDRNDSCRR